MKKEEVEVKAKVQEKEASVCSSCGKEIISGEIYTDRFYEALCRSCLLRLHEL